MQQLVRARLELLGQTLDQLGRSWAAGAAVTNARARPRPPGGAGPSAAEGGTRP
jgi:hypothetical protein